MRIRKGGLAVAAILGLALIVPPAGLAQRGEAAAGSQPFLHPVPDVETRAQVKGVEPQQVASLRFGGWAFAHYADGLFPEDMVITDTKLIRQIVQALHEADVYIPTHGQYSPMEPLAWVRIQFKPRKGTVPKPITLDFTPWKPNDCFGVKFYAAMQALERHRAALVRRLIPKVRPRVKSLLFEGRIGPQSVTQPQDVARLLDALEHVDERGNMLTQVGENDFSVTLEFRDGKSTELDFHPYWPPDSDPNANPPLPPALWNFDYVRRLMKK